ncbi:MAG: ribbon-helix-helix protein, CopG family [Candidatus Electryonea clarkiae]|nr:ribbon-helix-helix protein, CopG family [Candidatus Electryonea clarkiae]MDP8286690.1 ribbon-helix-helix protein, CopG family [Candidatus Electryonea clarkiae]
MARMTVQFPSKTSKILSEMAKKEEVSKTDIIRRALALYQYLGEEEDQGNNIAVTDKKDKVLKKIVFTK